MLKITVHGEREKMRLIDADEIKLPKGFFEKVDNVPKFYEWLGTLPTVDAVEVMRCKDCRFYASGWCKKWLEWSDDNNGFCSWAERR